MAAKQLRACENDMATASRTKIDRRQKTSLNWEVWRAVDRSVSSIDLYASVSERLWVGKWLRHNSESFAHGHHSAHYHDKTTNLE